MVAQMVVPMLSELRADKQNLRHDSFHETIASGLLKKQTLGKEKNYISILIFLPQMGSKLFFNILFDT
jgi:hypothetical protein